MKLSTLIEELQNLLEHEGDLIVVIPGDHQEHYHAGGAGVSYVMDGDCGLSTVHIDDLDYYKDEVAKVVEIW